MSISHSLAGLAAALPASQLLHCSGSESVSAITFRSDQVAQGAFFCAIRGTAKDGHEFVDQAFESGAVACMVSDAAVLKGRPGVVVSDGRSALSRLAAHWYGYPSRKLKLVGITGTNGKTTTNWVVFSLLGLLGVKALRMGTLGFFVPDAADDPESLTSPDPISVHRDLARALEAGAAAGVLEVASHALDQFRMHDVEFTSGVFTNLTRDHLDYHQTMEHYGESKLKLVDLIRTDGLMVINGDDPFSVSVAGRAGAAGLRSCQFSSRHGTEGYLIDNLIHDSEGSSFHLVEGQRRLKVHSPFSGMHNAQNVTGAMLSLLPLGYTLEQMIAVLPQVSQVPGRLESVGQQGVTVYVDYAHTPDALQNVLTVLRPLTQERLWVICGCGGDRDRGKRPQMARIAVDLADHAVFTSDNPRTEDPQQILQDMLDQGAKPEIVEVDRARAIEQTLSRAKPGDTVLIAGKGHEDYQIIGKTKYPFSDAKIVRDYFAASRGV